MRSIGRLRPLLISALLFSAPLDATGAPPRAPAPAPKPATVGDSLSGQAKADYFAGRDLASDGDYAGALVKFQSAYDASKDVRVLWNVAFCEKNLRHYARAIDVLRAYASDKSGLITEKERTDAFETIKTFESFTVSLTVAVNEADAEVFIDDKSVGRTPLGAQVVDIGSRRIRIHKDGFRDVTLTEAVGGNPTHTVSVKLEKEVHEGKLSLQAGRDALIQIDGKPMGRGRGAEAIELTLSSGGHTLRVTAPGMRTYEREVVVKDNETRALEVRLERAAAPELPRLRVAVGCVDDAPRSADEGLVVFVDGQAVTPDRGERLWDAQTKTTVTKHVDFPVEAGDHRVLVRIPGCEEMETRVDVRADGADLRGALRTDTSLLLRGPAGEPDWLRVGAGLWLPHGIGSFGVRQDVDANRALGNLSYTPRGAGLQIQLGVVGRWWTVMLEGGYAAGTANLATPPDSQDPIFTVPANNTTTQWLRAGPRFGVRLPFNVVALSLGGGTGYDMVRLTNLPPGAHWGNPHTVYGSAWTTAEVQVLCDWPAFASLSIDGHTSVKRFEIGGPTYGLTFGAAFQPSSRCRSERSTEYGLFARKEQR
jgi:hypothetical protein